MTSVAFVDLFEADLVGVRMYMGFVLPIFVFVCVGVFDMFVLVCVVGVRMAHVVVVVLVTMRLVVLVVGFVAHVSGPLH